MQDRGTVMTGRDIATDREDEPDSQTAYPVMQVFRLPHILALLDATETMERDPAQAHLLSDAVRLAGYDLLAEIIDDTPRRWVAGLLVALDRMHRMLAAGVEVEDAAYAAGLLTPSS